ncbi:MAG TPA: flagellin, partial [Solirubrobacteraceae bacterium]|nr:flagellin [Solirubrobacteraceae bacterium]
QYKNGSLSDSGKAAIQSEVNQLASEIDRIGKAASFNGITLLASASSVTFQVGANDGETISVSFSDLATDLGSSWVTLSNTGSISAIDAAIDQVSATRAGFGAVQNRLDHALAVAGTYQENLTSAESRIRDVDMAEEMVNLTKNQILQQAGTAMLAQANQAPQAVLQLLR